MTPNLEAINDVYLCACKPYLVLAKGHMLAWDIVCFGKKGMLAWDEHHNMQGNAFLLTSATWGRSKAFGKVWPTVPVVQVRLSHQHLQF